MTSINWSNLSTPADLLVAANTNTNNWFWTIMLYMIVIVIMLSMLSFSFETAMLVSAFIGTILGVLLIYMGLTSFIWVAPLAGILLFGIIYLMITSNKNQ